ncbi:hypothetical protein [Bacillus sp. TL12]|uniref:hypothetical protein n=1 Tax=Bacillus sp. TL12 TaxID=2894756 RepID=UPI001F52A702|nr:hypothetical protein [Bacillus sp. TL12]MCI0765828.1 hypothetical protein [Bacillus sp. TL12]
MAKEDKIPIDDLPKHSVDSAFEQEVSISPNEGNSLPEVLEKIEACQINLDRHHY